MQKTYETWVRSQYWEDLLEEGIVTHSSILTWKIPWTEQPGRLQLQVHKDSHITEVTQHVGILKSNGGMFTDKNTQLLTVVIMNKEG